MNYYYSDPQGNEIGPFPNEALKALWDSHSIPDTTLVRPEAGGPWTPVAELLKSGPRPASGPNQGQEVVEKAKSALKDALAAWGFLARNPVGGLPTAWEGLGPARAAAASYAMLGATFVLALGANIISRNPFRPQDAEGWFKWILAALIALSLLPAALVFGSKLLSKSSPTQGALLTAGSATLPWAVIILIHCLGNSLNENIPMGATLALVCVNALQVFIGLTRICKVSEGAASLLVPLALTLSIWGGRVIFLALCPPRLFSPENLQRQLQQIFQ